MTGASVALLRHGPTDWNAAGRLQGRADIALSEAGRAALSGFRPPAPWDAARWIASPLSRARETAALLTGSAPEIEPRLIEMDFGDWEGRRGVDLLADPNSGYVGIEDWGWAFRAPGGEGPGDLRDRLRPLFAELAADGRPTALVCHIGVMRVALALAHGWDFDGPPPFAVKRNRLFVLALGADGTPRPGAEPVVRLAARHDAEGPACA